MPPQFKFFRVGAGGDLGGEEELNRFLCSVRVLAARPELVHDGPNSFWTCAVEFLEGPGDEARGRKKGKVDYREILPPEDFAIFARLRDWRKEAAAREAVPVYTILTNEQIAQVAGQRPVSKSGLLKIEGIGEARAGKYGEEIVAIVRSCVEVGGPGGES